MKKRDAIIYARFSPRRFAEKCTSCEKQIEHCKMYAGLHDLNVVAVYRDDDISGKDMVSREGLNLALKHVCSSKGVLICFSLSRLARSVNDCLVIAEQLKNSSADLALLDISMDTSTPVGKLFFVIMAALDQFERERTAERTSVAMKFLQANGHKISSNPPFGYVIDPSDNSKIIPHAQEQDTIEQITRLKELGCSLREIARTLEQDGRKCRGSRWHHVTIKRILSRKF